MNRFIRTAICMALAIFGFAALTDQTQGATVLKFADQNPETGWVSVHGTQPYIKKLEEESGGSLKFELYGNQSLAKGNQTWAATRKGIADMSWNAMAMNAGMNPLAEVITLPGLPYSDPMTASAALWEAYQKFPQMAKPYDGNRVLALYTSDNFNLISTKPIKTLEDLKGKKIRTIAGPLVSALESLGAIPVVIPMPDVYLALQRGTIDGALSSWESYNGFRFYEVANNVITNAPLGFSFFVIAMNKNAYNRLDEKDKAVIDANSGKEGSIWWARNASYSCRVVPEELAAKGVKLNTYELPAEERQRWIETGAAPVWESWKKTTEDKGFSEAGAVLDFILHPSK